MKQTVVIADADVKFRTELVTALEGCEEFEVVGIAEDGAQAIQIITEKRPDILVLDLLLPQYDGLTVLRQLRGMWKRPKSLVTSAFISNYVAASAMRLGAQQLLPKPCSVDVIIKNLQQMANGEKGGSVIFLWNKKKR